MSERDRGELLFLVKALTTWFVCAVSLCLLFALVICKTSVDSSYIGYFSSFISFVCAVAAGYKAYTSRKGNSIYTALFTAVFLIIVLLSIGFIVTEESLKSASVLSVGTFTFVGVLTGAQLLPSLKSKKSIRKNKKGKKATKLT